MQNPLRAKGAVTALSLIALICAALSSITYFVRYVSVYPSSPSLTFRVPAMRDLLSYLWYIIPFVLLFLCVLLYNGQKKDTILLIAMLGMSASSLFFTFLINSFVHGGSFTVLNALDLLVLAPLFALAAIFAMSGRAKVFVIIGTALGTFAELIELPSTLEYVRWTLNSSFYLHTATYLIGTLGALMLNATLLIFAAANTPPSLFGQTES